MTKDMTNEMVEIIKDNLVEYSHYFNQSMEDYNGHATNSSLGSLESELTL